MHVATEYDYNNYAGVQEHNIILLPGAASFKADKQTVASWRALSDDYKTDNGNLGEQWNQYTKDQECMSRDSR